jgi:hypothetical protein
MMYGNIDEIPAVKVITKNNLISIKFPYQVRLLLSISQYVVLALFSQQISFYVSVFCVQLHEMLTDCEKEGHERIISWLPCGKGFKVHKTEEFVKTILPTYFNQSKYKSFTRQLYIYGFRMVRMGHTKGAFFHYKFTKDDKSVSLSIGRHKLNATTEAGGWPNNSQDTTTPYVTSLNSFFETMIRPNNTDSEAETRPAFSLLFSRDSGKSREGTVVTQKALNEASARDDDDHHDGSMPTESCLQDSNLAHVFDDMSFYMVRGYVRL